MNKSTRVSYDTALNVSNFSCKSSTLWAIGVLRTKPAWVTIKRRAVANVAVEIRSGSQAHRIFGDEPSKLWVVPAGAVVKQAGERISFAAGVAVTRLRAADGVAVRVVGLAF